jgi:hypothetical protein
LLPLDLLLSLTLLEQLANQNVASVEVLRKIRGHEVHGETP